MTTEPDDDELEKTEGGDYPDVEAGPDELLEMSHGFLRKQPTAIQNEIDEHDEKPQ